MKPGKTILFCILILLATCTLNAQVTITMKSSGAYVGYYTISYQTNSGAVKGSRKTIYAGGNQPNKLPKGAYNIKIKMEFKSVFSDYDLTTINANRSGGVATFKGMLGATDFDWEPEDESSGIGTQDLSNINKVYPNGDAELHRAARESNAIQMQSLIDNRTTMINQKNTRGYTPLHESVQKGFEQGVDILLKSGADMNVQNMQGETPFVMAINLGNMQIASKFINNGYIVRNEPKAMEAALRKRNEAMVKLLLDNGADPNTTINNALSSNNIPMVEMIMDNYAPTLSIDLFKKTMDSRRFDLAQRMVEEGVDANQAMDYAISKNSPEIVQAAMEKGGDAQKALRYAIVQRKPDLAGSAVANFSANPNLVMEDAIKANQTDVVALLLDNNADPNTGLTAAINNNKTNFIGMMIDRGARVSADQISKVAATGDNVLLPKLIEAGGDVNAGLSGAMAAKKYETAAMLIQAGARPDNIVVPAVTANQKNLLIAALDAGADANPGLAPAVNAGFTDLVDLLFKGGATVTDPALIKTAVSKNNTSMVQMMLQNGAKPNDGLAAAIAANSTSLSKILIDAGANAADPAFLIQAVKNKNSSLVSMLLDNGAIAEKGLLAAVEVNDLGIAQMLTQKGAKASDPNMIKTAVKNQNTGMVALMLKTGADPKVAIKDAVVLGNAPIVKQLITAGADGSAPDLMKASVPRNSPELTGLLIAAGGNPQPIASDAVYANAIALLKFLYTKGVKFSDPKYLQTSVSANNVDLTSFLVGSGVDIKWKDSNGNNYLHLAAEKEADKVVVILARAGVPVNELNNAKSAPLHIAAVQGRSEVELVESFIAAGADVNLRNGNGETALGITKGSRIKRRLKDAGGKE